jgi:hypothetical protein
MRGAAVWPESAIPFCVCAVHPACVCGVVDRLGVFCSCAVQKERCHPVCVCGWRSHWRLANPEARQSRRS